MILDEESHIFASHKINSAVIFYFISFYFVFLPFSRATPTEHGGSQARGSIGAVAAGWPTLEPQQCGIRAESATYTTAHGNARSPTH